MRHRKKSCVDRRGLVLLIVLGMIAMFSLLAVTYVVMSGDSRDASRAVLRGERQRNFDLDAIGRSVLTNMVVGTNDQQSPFYQHDILGDVYGRQSFVTKAHVFGATPSWQLMANPAITAMTTRLPDFCMFKLSLNPVAENGFTLSEFENDYNSRILTVLEGPLTGQSFRIIKYIGHVNPILTGGDPNVDLTPWSSTDYSDSAGANTAYSVVIDLNDIKGERFTGSFFPPSSTEESSVTLSTVEWIQRFGIESLFYKPRPIATAPYEGFRLLVNGAPFNSVGIGIEEIGELPSVPPFVRGFGNIDSKRLMRIPSNRNIAVSPALLPHYDYLNDRDVMNENPLIPGDFGVDGVGTPRNSAIELKLRGQSNEGYDVPDYRDHWLGHITNVYVSSTPDIWTKWVKPSYHQPAVIQYLANLFGDPASLAVGERDELLKLVDMSSARVLSYPRMVNGNMQMVNANFMSREPDYPRLPLNPTPAQVQQFMLSQITGKWGAPPMRNDRSWDVDNDGDGEGDAVWIDPRLPVVYGPEGQRLKPLVAITTIDMDGRVNLNAAGERVEALGPMFPQSNAGFKQQSLLPAGFGYGPKEISLARLLSPAAIGPIDPGQVSGVLKSSSAVYSFFDELYGARRSPTYGRFPIDFTSFATDRSPGRRDADDHFPWHRHREVFTGNNTLPGMPIGRRGSIGLSFDRNGNPAWIQRPDTDVLPTNPGAFVSANETVDDGYEFSPMGKPISDDPLNLTELETLLRRYDADAASLPPRIREVFTRAGFGDINNHIYEAVTTRSGELRYPNIGAALSTQVGTDRVILHETPSLLRYLQWLHNQRYRVRESNDPLVNDPEVSYAALTELFSTDFSAGLRMDLNRPFGDGVDSDSPLGQIDDPLELQNMPQVEDAAGTPGAYTREIYLSGTKPSTPPTPFPSSTRVRLGSRQVLARHLYCLAQLIIPKQHNFPGMEGLDETTQFLRRSEIRARAIAQWAINVVDFRDADSTMSRFEYDIFPFGLGGDTATRSNLARRPAYWAPDHVGETMNGIPNKRYIGVVWGMEMPELVLSETLALHDKRVRDTDIDLNSQLVNPNGTDPDFDQYRFPQASLFIELKAVRTAANNGMFVPGVSRLHRLVNGEMHLDLGAMAPATARWGQQPVWRIAISQDYEQASVVEQERPLIESNAAGASTNTDVAVRNRMNRVTHQFSFELFGTNPASTGNPDLATSNTIEEYLGNGLIYDPLTFNPAIPATTKPTQLDGFERFVWFANVDPTGDVPDILPSIRSQPTVGTSNWQVSSVYRARGNSLTDNSHLLRGGEYLVVAPRLETPIGSLTHHPFVGNLFPQSLRRSDIAANPNNRPVNAPSRQRISLVPDVTRPFQFPAVTGDRTVRQFSFNGEHVNQVWWQHSRRPKALVCAVPILDDPATQNYFDNQNGTDWDLPFPNGIGLNISYPTPVHSSTYSPTDYWHTSHRPSVRLNTGDRLQGTGANRTDETLGFADDDYLVSDPNGAFFPPDSWVDTANPTTNFPDRPFDRDNPFVGGSGRYRSGTYENVRTAYLQRLADPDFPYDPYANPYITVDWMPIDLTVFNGEANSADDPQDLVPLNPPPGTLVWNFQSRYRDGRLTPGVAASPALGRASGISVYAPNTPELRTSLQQTFPPSAPASAEYPFGFNFESYFTHSLGYDGLISWGGLPQASGTTLGYTNVGFHTAGALLIVANALDGDVDGFGIPLNSPEPAFQGSTTFLQGLYWANRPFASPYEIMMVPATGPGNFGLYHSGYTGNERKGFAFLPSFQANNAWNFDYPGNDHRRSYWAIPDVNSTTNFETDWGLILDFVETKPPFIDADKKLDPATVFQSIGGGVSPPAWAGVANRFLNSFIPQGYYNNVANGPSPSRVRGPTLLAPFNSLPSFVAAGKVNINTVTFGADGRSKALESVEQHYLRGANIAAAFANSRAGYDSTDSGMSNSFFGSKILHFNPNLPTDFAGAFRPAMTSNLAPELHTPAATAEMRGRWNAQAGLMRAFDLGANSSATQSTQTLAFNSVPAAHGAEVLNGQPFAKYQRMMRLPNLVTNQSNVFASWVTISLFEYDPIEGFGNEYVSPNGEPIRERYFYIIDRTVPVGYLPGERLNMKRTILLEKKL
jgi:hypothetical protein